MVLRTTEQFSKVFNSEALFPKVFHNGKNPVVKIEKFFWAKMKNSFSNIWKSSTENIKTVTVSDVNNNFKADSFP